MTQILLISAVLVHCVTKGLTQDVGTSQSFHMLPSYGSARFMCQTTGLPIQNGVGKMYVLPQNNVIVWENTGGTPGQCQFMGWRSEVFAGKSLKISFWIKFLDTLPGVGDVAIKVYGVEHSAVFENCTTDIWCYVSTNVSCPESGDDYHVVLTFDDVGQEQKVYVKDLRVTIFERSQILLRMPEVIMGGTNVGFPQAHGVGKMYSGSTNDWKFLASEIFTWENTAGMTGSWQWLGWQRTDFANQILKISFWIKYVDQVPARSNNYGVKVYGALYNEFLKHCTRVDEWCFVQKTVKCRDHGDANHVVLIFDSIPHKQVIHVARLKLKVIESVREQYSLLSSPHRLVMNKANGFPQTFDVGRMFTGQVNDTTFYPNEIITWQNTAGYGGVWQWFGWWDTIFANKLLRISFWILFVDDVPERSSSFGVKVYGVVYNDFVKDCVADTWCYVEEVVKCKNSGGSNLVLLAFDTISRNQTVSLTRFYIDIV